LGNKKEERGKEEKRKRGGKEKIKENKIYKYET